MPLAGYHKYAKKLNEDLPQRENREGDSFMSCYWTAGVSGHMVSIINTLNNLNISSIKGKGREDDDN